MYKQNIDLCQVGAKSIIIIIISVIQLLDQKPLLIYSTNFNRLPEITTIQTSLDPSQHVYHQLGSVQSLSTHS